MGIYLQKIATFCDCLQNPWTIPTTPQTHHNDSEANLQNQTHRPNHPSILNIFHQQQSEQDEEKGESNCQTTQSIKFSEEKIGEDRIQQEMEIIDLEKILPVIVKQSHEKAKLKRKEKRVQEEMEVERESVGEVSNVFENGRYLIEEDEAEFYKIEMGGQRQN